MAVQRTQLSPYSVEYEGIERRFNAHNSTADYMLDLVRIERVENATLKARFKTQEWTYKARYGQVRIQPLFHGTKSCNIRSILKDNLDPRLHGNSVGHRFGAGVSFSAQASYASHYCDDGDQGQMLLCDVLISNIINVPEMKNGFTLSRPPYLPGNSGLVYDTTAKNRLTMDVVVKWKANEFYPSHVITFNRLLHGDSTDSYSDDDSYDYSSDSSDY